MDRVRTVCAKIVVGPKQLKELQARLFRHVGVRFPQQQLPMFQELESLDKLQRLSSSAMRPLAPDERRAFSGKGHDRVSDDIHLYEAARTGDRIVVTSDDHLLDGASRILAATGVHTFAPEDL